MKRASGIVMAAIGAFTGSLASAQGVDPGVYLCDVLEHATIASSHLEDSGPPEASVVDAPYRFRILVSGEAGALRIIEIPYDGPVASRLLWEDENSTLHTAYQGDGRAFLAERGTGFLNFRRDRWGAELQFHHAGYQYAGGEDEHLSVRWGRCSVDR